MIDTIKNLIDSVMYFVNWLFFLKINLDSEHTVALGVLTIAFLFIIYSLYFMLRSIGIIGDGGEE